MVSFTHQPLYPQEVTPGTDWLGCWVGPRVGLDAMAKTKILNPCRESKPSRPARSQALHRLPVL